MLLGKFQSKEYKSSILNRLYSSVNFKRMIPQAGFFKSSEVFKQLNEEAVKTKMERDKEVKKWTTFLQKPNRPIPKSKEEIEREKLEPYRVKIVKQPKPKCDPNRPPSPIQIPQEEPKRIEEKPFVADTIPFSVETAPTEIKTATLNGNSPPTTTAENGSSPDEIADSEVPDLEPCTEEELTAWRSSAEQEINNPPEQIEPAVEQTSVEPQNVEQTVEITENIGEQSIVPTKPKNPEDELLEQRLAEVQNQLAALSTLPTTIQATLESVSRQLAELMPAFRIRTSIDISGCMNDDSNMKLTEEINIEKETKTEEPQTNMSSSSEFDVKQETTEVDVSIKETDDIHVEITKTIETNGNGTHNGDGDFVSVDEIALSTDEHLLQMKTEKTFMQQESEWIKTREKVRENIALHLRRLSK